MALNTKSHEWLQTLCVATQERHDEISEWEKSFMSDTAERVEKYGIDTRVSPKQWVILRRIADKLDLPEMEE